jgi:lipoprotein signal peptidase
MATRTATRAASTSMRYRLLLAVAASVTAADLLTKGIASVLSHTFFAIRLPGGWWLQVVHNNGVILGLGAGTIAPDVFAVAVAVEIAVLMVLNRHQGGRLWAVALGLILGAYVGNAGESRLTGYVVDWIHPPHLPIAFDLADVAVVCGQVLMLALVAREGGSRTRAAVAQ